MMVLLVTRDQTRNGSAAATAWSGIFADENTLELDETERNVLAMVKTSPQVWSCGCVIGYPEHLFSVSDRELLEVHGVGKRFSL